MKMFIVLNILQYFCIHSYYHVFMITYISSNISDDLLLFQMIINIFILNAARNEIKLVSKSIVPIQFLCINA